MAESLVDWLLDSEDEEDDFRLRQAEEYFSVGHHNAHDEYEMDGRGDEEVFAWRAKQPPRDQCWIWDGESLRVDDGHTHNMSFGNRAASAAPFKGWYDTGKGLLSFIDQRRSPEVKTEDDIPERLYRRLKEQFRPRTIRIF